METDEISHETGNYTINQSLELLECSPLKVFDQIEHYQLVKGRSRMLQQILAFGTSIN